MSHQHEKNLAASIIKALFSLDPVLVLISTTVHVRYDICCSSSSSFVLSRVQ